MMTFREKLKEIRQKAYVEAMEIGRSKGYSGEYLDGFAIGYSEGYVEGVVVGYQRTNFECAVRMHKMGRSDEYIADCLGLSVEEVQEMLRTKSWRQHT